MYWHSASQVFTRTPRVLSQCGRINGHNAIYAIFFSPALSYGRYCSRAVAGMSSFMFFNLASQWPRRRDVAPRCCCCLGIRRSQRQRRRHRLINSDVLRSAFAVAAPVARNHTWFDYSNEVCVSEAAERHIPWRQRSTRQSDRYKGRKYNPSS